MDPKDGAWNEQSALESYPINDSCDLVIIQSSEFIHILSEWSINQVDQVVTTEEQHGMSHYPATTTIDISSNCMGMGSEPRSSKRHYHHRSILWSDRATTMTSTCCDGDISARNATTSTEVVTSLSVQVVQPESNRLTGRYQSRPSARVGWWCRHAVNRIGSTNIALRQSSRRSLPIQLLHDAEMRPPCSFIYLFLFT